MADKFSRDDELAAALLQIDFDWPDGARGPIMSHEDAKKISAKHVISLFQRDHYPRRREQGGPSVHWNLTWRPIANHRHKTAKVDQPQIAKVKRVAAKTEEHRRKMLAKSNGEVHEQTDNQHKPIGARRKQKIKSAGFRKPPKGHVYDWKQKRYVKREA